MRRTRMTLPEDAWFTIRLLRKDIGLALDEARRGGAT